MFAEKLNFSHFSIIARGMKNLKLFKARFIMMLKLQRYSQHCWNLWRCDDLNWCCKQRHHWGHGNKISEKATEWNIYYVDNQKANATLKCFWILHLCNLFGFSPHDFYSTDWKTFKIRSRSSGGEDEKMMARSSTIMNTFNLFEKVSV